MGRGKGGEDASGELDGSEWRKGVLYEFIF
jgi:hypothetical protein